MKKFRRAFLVVLDGVGVGAAPDAREFGDEGSDTLGNLSQARPLHLPFMESLGLGNLTRIQGVKPLSPGAGRGAYARAQERSCGKDTTSGHWEMAGVVVETPFAVFPNGFSSEVIDRWVKENHLPGVLGNMAASGTEIIKDLGEEHIRTGKPIVYTSADSVWQVAAHEETFGLKRLHEVCLSARKICDELQIGRVISRPFVGKTAKDFKRTYNRKDYSQLPPARTYLDELCEKGVATLGVGKISNIYAGQGIQKNIDTKGNTDGLRVLIEQADHTSEGLIFCNLIDTDMLYGHRRDVEGFATAVEEIDQALEKLAAKLDPNDLLCLVSDHGNDPTFRGTDHTREYTPLMVYTPSSARGVDLKVRNGFGDVGATLVHALTGSESSYLHLQGQSFLKELVS